MAIQTAGEKKSGRGCHLSAEYWILIRPWSAACGGKLWWPSKCDIHTCQWTALERFSSPQRRVIVVVVIRLGAGSKTYKLGPPVTVIFSSTQTFVVTVTQCIKWSCSSSFPWWLWRLLVPSTTTIDPQETQAASSSEEAMDLTQEVCVPKQGLLWYKCRRKWMNETSEGRGN